VFVLTDGRRFQCSGQAFARSAPSPGVLARSRSCVALRRLKLPPGSRAVDAALGRARACLTGHGLRVAGGPVPPGQPTPTAGPDGELIVVNRTGPAFIAFYRDPGRAAQLEPGIGRNARRTGGQVERRGAVTIVWRHAPAPTLRAAVRACAF
jgi:hypothetical protein